MQEEIQEEINTQKIQLSVWESKLQDDKGQWKEEVNWQMEFDKLLSDYYYFLDTLKDLGGTE